MKQINLGPAQGIEVGQGRAFEVEGRRIAVIRTPRGQLHALNDTCPHAGGSLAGGLVGTTNVICPLHGWKFGLQDGACRNDPSYRIKTYRVVERDGDIWLTVE